MSKISGLSLLSLFFLGLCAQPALALPAVCKLWLAEYQSTPVASAANEAKCNICHYGKTKKNRNDFGQALSKLGVTKDNYDALKDDEKKLEETLKGAFKKCELEKSVSGAKFGDLIKQGKLPGTAPEGEE
jgi:hypothetical protein